MSKFFEVRGETVVLRRNPAAGITQPYAFPLERLIGDHLSLMKQLSSKPWWHPRMTDELEQLLFEAEIAPKPTPTVPLVMRSLAPFGVGKAWVARNLRVWTPDSSPKETCVYLNPPNSRPDLFDLEVGYVHFIHRPFYAEDGEISYERYFVLATQDGVVKLDKKTANEIIASYQTEDVCV